MLLLRDTKINGSSLNSHVLIALLPKRVIFSKCVKLFEMVWWHLICFINAWLKKYLFFYFRIFSISQILRQIFQHAIPANHKWINHELKIIKLNTMGVYYSSSTKLDSKVPDNISSLIVNNKTPKWEGHFKETRDIFNLNEKDFIPPINS